MLIVIAVIGTLSGIAIMSMIGVEKYSAAAVAQRNLDLLNGAVNSFNNANWKLPVAVSGGGDDEQTVFHSLQYRDALNPAPGSPYLPAHLPLATSSSAETYRATWNGTYFQMTEPGVDGTGIDLEAMGKGAGGGPPSAFRPPRPAAN